MKVFADAVYFLGLMSRRDQWHASAVRAADKLTDNIVTTEWVLLEVANTCATQARRQKFLRLVRRIEQDPTLELVEINRQHFLQGVTLYEARPDKEWSLTDCISFIVMEEQGLTEALTADKHFEQAGFKCLLLD